MTKKQTKLQDGEQEQILPVNLTEDEIRVRGQELGALDLRLNEEIQDEKDRASAAREDIKTTVAARDVLAQIVKSGQEDREVIVKRVPDIGRDLTEIVRTDTGEIVATVELTENDRQMKLIN